MKILYLCPDFSLPSGGIKRLYTHVEVLRENGYDAYIVHAKKGFKLTWFDNQVPTLYSSDSLRVDPGDTIVISETFPQMMKQVKGLPFKKVVIALNPVYIFEAMPLGENWNDYGINWVMTNSKIIRDLIQWSMGIENVYVVESSVDRDMFYYNPDVKTQQLAYIKRKDMLSSVVEKILKSRDGSFGKLDFIAIENLNIENYAQVLRKSRVYLTTSRSEGFPRSIIEAMACGCLCVGFDGIGGKDFIIGSGDRQNFVLAESMNFFDLSQKLAELLEKEQTRDPAVETIRQNALSTAQRFSADLEKESILKFWKTFFEAES